MIWTLRMILHYSDGGDTLKVGGLTQSDSKWGEGEGGGGGGLATPFSQ